MLDEKAVQIINSILAKGGSIEIRRRKNEIVILQIKGTEKHKIPIKRE